MKLAAIALASRAVARTPSVPGRRSLHGDDGARAAAAGGEHRNQTVGHRSHVGEVRPESPGWPPPAARTRPGAAGPIRCRHGEVNGPERAQPEQVQLGPPLPVRTSLDSRPEMPPDPADVESGARRRQCVQDGQGRVDVARPYPRPRSGSAWFHVPLGWVSREIGRRIPTAAKLTTSDEPPEETSDGSVMPVWEWRGTTPDVDEGLDRQPRRDAHRQQRAEGVRCAQRHADAAVGEEEEQADDARRRPGRAPGPTMAKMKSLSAFGTTGRPGWLLWPRPMPRTPPIASAAGRGRSGSRHRTSNLKGSRNTSMRFCW